MPPDRRVTRVIGIPIDVLSRNQAVEKILNWAAEGGSRYVTLCNVHVTVTAACNPGFQKVVKGADMALPDGAPVAWMLRRKGHADHLRISGPDLMQQLLKGCSRSGIRVFFYGSTENVLAKLKPQLRRQYPGLPIAGMVSPPFRPLKPHEDRDYVRQINASGAGIVFVGLGCPKQERWMRRHRGRVAGVLIGVGAAFDFHAGTLRRAPLWMRRSGLEWLHRLSREPKRLTKRYLVTNGLFLILSFLDLLNANKAFSWLTSIPHYRSPTNQDEL